MSWLLFLDESGHDHKTMPYEVRGGVALDSHRLWSFVQSIQENEKFAFGTFLSEYKHELKGSKLVDKKRFKFSQQDELMNDEERQKHCEVFLKKGLSKQNPCRKEFSAYGQACFLMAKKIFETLKENNAKIFASAIPRGIQKPENPGTGEFLRKDQVFLLERFYYFLEETNEDGLLILDAIETNNDKKFVKQLEDYFKKTNNGKIRQKRIIPSPLFVSSDMAYPVQAADLCIYCINWGFRLPSLGMNAATRHEIETQFGKNIFDMQYKKIRDGSTRFDSYGIVYVADPYTSRKEKEATP